jgi:hypothetical protein
LALEADCESPNKPLHPTADSASGVDLAFNSAVGELGSLGDFTCIQYSVPFAVCFSSVNVHALWPNLLSSISLFDLSILDYMTLFHRSKLFDSYFEPIINHLRVEVNGIASTQKIIKLRSHTEFSTDYPNDWVAIIDDELIDLSLTHAGADETSFVAVLGKRIA